MPTLTTSQVKALRNQGLTDDKIQALALKNGYELPKEGFLSSLFSSERGFGQSIAGALGSTVLSKEKTALQEANDNTRRIQGNLIKIIQDKRSKGEDTTKLVSTLKSLDKEVNFYDILNANTGGSLNKTGRQIFGEGLGVATDIIAGGTLPGKAFQVGKGVKAASGFVQGAKVAGKVGALTGATLGAAYGVSGAAQENRTGGEIVGSGLRTAALSGATGGILGGILGGVGGRLASRAERQAGKELDFALDFVAPEATKKAKIAAGKEGRVTKPGLLRPAKILPSKRDYQLADVVDGIVNPRQSVPQNIDNITNKVREINTGVKTYIEQNKVPFNTNQLRSRLSAGADELRLIFASDKTAEKTYKAVVDEFMNHVSKKDTLGLFEARQSFDKIPAIRKLLESQALGENARKQIVLEVRRAANEYVSSLLPAGNPYKPDLRQETLLLEALANAATKNVGTIGKNKLQLLAQQYPGLNWLIGGAAGAAILGGSVGVGRSIVNSTD